MICASVVPCLSSGLAKNNKMMSMFVLFSWSFCNFESLAFFPKMLGSPLHQSSQAGCFCQFLKSTAIK